jgi:hypothetical protein
LGTVLLGAGAQATAATPATVKRCGYAKATDALYPWHMSCTAAHQVVEGSGNPHADVIDFGPGWDGGAVRINGRYWVFARYFGTFNKARQDRWVFGDRASGAYLHKFSWTNIVRPQIVRHGASPDDPELADYWTWRRRKAPLPINRTALWLHREQAGRCATCKGTLVADEDRPQTPRQ